MTFTTLKDRFEAVSAQIYSKFPPDRDQILKIKPNTRGGNLITGAFKSTSRIKDDSRLLPTVSFIRDSKRITEFLTSPEGIRFVAKQFLLQSGNTFIGTRVYGGGFTSLMIPGTHELRHFKPINTPPPRPGGLPVLPVSRLVQEIPGLLQVPTVHQFTIGPVTTENTSILKSIFSPLTNVLSAIVTPQNIPNLIYRRPEFKVYMTKIGDKNSFNTFLRLPETITQRSTVKNTNFQLSPLGKFDTRALTYGQLRDQRKEGQTDYYFQTPGYNAILTNGIYDNGKLYQTNLLDVNGKDVEYINVPLGRVGYKDFEYLDNKKFNYDPLNVNVSGSKLPGTTNNRKVLYATGSGLINYNILQGERGENTSPDIINFAFQTNQQDAPIIKFRAFISTFKQNIKPDYKEEKYLGRTERFVTYSGAKRTATLSFNIVAFSRDELENIWTRINYLSGLAFPLNVSKSGFMVPPLFKISIGKIYDAQPCYIESLDFDFIDDNITFDIDQQVSQYVNVNMSITLLEKRSKYYNSPFYQITQELVEQK